MQQDCKQLRWTITYKNVILEKLYNLPPLDPEVVIDQYLSMLTLAPHVVDTPSRFTTRFNDAIFCLKERRNAFDLDHGTYPYVTSSNPVAGELVGTGTDDD